MNDKLFVLDKKLPFRRKIKSLEQLNLYQLYSQRYGIGHWASRRISMFSAVHENLNVERYNYNLINQTIREVFSRNELFLDNHLTRSATNGLQRHVSVYNYRGSRYIDKLPLNGQRRRTNANTCKRVRPLSLNFQN